jgi:uncharacterized protein YceH (UPF0502 family)
LHALTAACNQKSNREPVMSLDEDTVHAALESLRAKGLTVDISGGDHRVHKYAHRLGEVFNFDRREQTLLCVLMLRGPQTVGELRGRSERLHDFDSLDDVESTLSRLADRTPPLAKKLSRRPGEKEARFAHLLSGDVESGETTAPPPPRPSPLEARVAQLESDLADLKRQFQDFRKGFE